MNASIIDPLQGGFPEAIEEYLEHGIMKCISFNCRGTLLAAGCSDGSCVIWDFETRGIAKELREIKDHTSAVTSVCWSKSGRRLLVSTADKLLTLWDVLKGEKIASITLQQTSFVVRLHPSSSSSSICLSCPLSSAPLLVDLNTRETTVLPVTLPDTSGDDASPARNKPADGMPSIAHAAACFNKCGDLIYLGNNKGEILLIDYKSLEVLAMILVSGGAAIKNILFSKNGQYLLTNSSDRTIRIYENLLPSKGGLAAAQEHYKTVADDLDIVEKLKSVGSKCLAVFREFQDSITKIHWKAPCFSGDGEWVVGGSASREHKIYIWDRAGHLVKILEGPKEAIIDLAWHPVHPIVVSVSLTGLAYIWAKDYTENWSAFAPDFKELEENEEYVEREDEFDLMPETEKVEESDVNEDDIVDIVKVEKDDFTDSDMSQEELRFLPATPCPDAQNRQDKCAGSSSKLIGCNNSGSPLSEEAGQNGQATNHASSPLEDDTGSTLVKRKRKPSEKGLVLQTEKVKKPSKPLKSDVDMDYSNDVEEDNKSNDYH